MFFLNPKFLKKKKISKERKFFVSQFKEYGIQPELFSPAKSSEKKTWNFFFLILRSTFFKKSESKNTKKNCRKNAIILVLIIEEFSL